MGQTAASMRHGPCLLHKKVSVLGEFHTLVASVVAVKSAATIFKRNECLLEVYATPVC